MKKRRLTNKPKVSIVGSVGVPANYGGFETLAERLAINMASKTEMHIFCSSKAYGNKEKYFHKAKLHYIPLKANGIQSILYDIISVIMALFVSDTIIVLGISGTIIFPLIRLIPGKKVILNPDGMEWKRSKWRKRDRYLLSALYKTGLLFADEIVSDHIVIQRYIKLNHNKNSTLIPYGSDHMTEDNKHAIYEHKIPDKPYYLAICRIEPENSIKLILDTFKELSHINLLFIGNWNNSAFSESIYNKYSKLDNITLLNSVYNNDIINKIRSGAIAYIHGHTCGGTNPSLIDAMRFQAPIIAHNNIFNRHTTNHKSIYFRNKEELSEAINKTKQTYTLNRDKYESENRVYTWSNIADMYYNLIS
ncbi:MAG: DUF1972 domain-containing protein [Bacteroidales bacterium]|nr:DUF1972 domain-containing protein [Bacteroidales bacterium]